MLLLPTAGLFVVRASAKPAGGAASVRLPGHVPIARIANSRLSGQTDAAEPVSLAVCLPLRNQSALQDLIRRMYDPTDPLSTETLTPAEFTERFGPTLTDYQSVAAFVQSQGLRVTGTSPNRVILDVAGPAALVEQAFQTRLLQFQAADGRVFRAPETDPAVPAALAGKISAVVGLATGLVLHKHLQKPAAVPGLAPDETGSGFEGGLTPSDIKTAYHLNSVSQTGNGQTLAVYELDGYDASDIAQYEAQFDLPNVPLKDILVDNATGMPGSGQDEVTLDIELQIAIAPSVEKILVYEAPNGGNGLDNPLLDLWNRIANDDLASAVSTSWGLDERDVDFEDPSLRPAEADLFSQMATQRQTVTAASGDSGAYDIPNNHTELAVDDPASQVMVTGVGGTSLTTAGAGGPWQSETTWNAGYGSAGGGGISSNWPIPAWQAGVVPADSQGSLTRRNVPDVSLSADPNQSGYAIFLQGKWTVYGGTSCASPLWAAFLTLLNQARVAQSLPTIGFANPALYAIGRGSSGAGDFHDIVTGTNLYYPAVPGHDDATGWGTLNGASLLADLVGAPLPVSQLSQPVYSVEEGNTAAILVTRASSTGTASVGFSTADGTAHAPGDYTSVSETVSFANTVSSVQVNVPTVLSGSLFGTKTVNLALNNPSSLSLGSPSTSVLTISQNTARPAPSNAVAVVAGASALAVAWTRNSTNEDLFEILRSTNGGAFVQIGTAPAGATSYLDSTVQAGSTTYSYEVVAAITSPAVQSNPSNATVAISAPGIGTGLAKVSPAKLSFSGKPGQTTAAQAITITNAGKGVVTGTVTVPYGVPFVLVGSASFSIAPKKSVKIRIAFAPTTVSKTAVVSTATVNNNGTGGTVTVALSGKAP